MLKGYDALMNLVLDDVKEALRGEDTERDSSVYFQANRRLDDEGNEMTRSLGLVIVRGTLLVVISPVDGSEVIANPFLQESED